MTELDLRGNQLSSLPSIIGNLKSLRILDLRENKLKKKLPDCIRDLANLEKLDVLLNKELTIPEWIRELEQRECSVFY